MHPYIHSCTCTMSCIILFLCVEQSIHMQPCIHYDTTCGLGLCPLTMGIDTVMTTHVHTARGLVLFSSQRAPVESERETSQDGGTGLWLPCTCGCRITMIVHARLPSPAVPCTCTCACVHYNTMIRKQAVDMYTCHNKYASTAPLCCLRFFCRPERPRRL